MAPLGSVRFLTIHCAATPEGRDVKASTISQWDIARFGQVSYHWVVELDGSKHNTLSDDLKGAHVTARCGAAEVRNSQLEFAVQMATDEIERIAPDSTVPAQIRRLLAATVPHPLPSGIKQPDMDKIRGGEA